MSTATDKTFAAIFALWLFGALASIGLTVGVIYVVIHFIHKLW